MRKGTSGRWGGSDDVIEQAHREALGATRALEAFLITLQGKTVLLRTDCLCVQAASGVGSKKSEVLQNEALKAWRIAAKWGIHLRSAWISGDRMIDNGVDYRSREGAKDNHDVRITNELWNKAEEMGRGKGIRMSIDWFAEPTSARCERFWSREQAAGTAGVNALDAPSWGTANGCTCGMVHDVGGWFFPPVPLASMVVEKMKLDGAHGVALMPFRPDAPWWPVFFRGVTEMATVGVTGAMEVRGGSLDQLPEMYRRVSWRLCCFDFGTNPARVYNPQCATSNPWLKQRVTEEAVEARRYLAGLMARHGATATPAE